MKITMNDSRITITNITQLRAFLKGAEKFDFSLRDGSIEEKYKFIDKTVDRLGYSRLRKKDKRAVVRYLQKITGYKSRQLYRLIKQAKVGKLARKEYRRKNPNRNYSAYDIKLLERTDELHLRLNAVATKEILRREYEIFKKDKYETIAQVSASHINNLRHTPVYRNHWVNHTKARQLAIGVRLTTISATGLIHILTITDQVSFLQEVSLTQMDGLEKSTTKQLSHMRR